MPPRSTRTRDVLAREGALLETPFPLLLASLLEEERTCTLELRLRNLEKRIAFEDGVPVGCQSNLLHETLGRYLVDRGKLSEPDFQKVLAESAAQGKQMGSLLIERGLISAFDLYKQLQGNLAHRILDCFRWHDARFRLLEFDAPQMPIKLNSRRLVYTGSIHYLPFEVITRHLVFDSARRFALTKAGLEDLKLSGKDARFVQALKERPDFSQLVERSGFPGEPAMRRLYALYTLGIVDFADAIVAAAVSEPPPAPEPVVERMDYLDDVESARNALAAELLALRGKDPFELLEVPVDVQAPALRRAFLSRAEALSPSRFRSPELKEKAESLLCAYARAFAALAEHESYLLHRRRREVAEEARRAPARPSAAQQLRIRTDLLDAGTQFEEGKKLLEAGNFHSAAEYFEYASDIEPRGRHLAYLAWARYRLHPNTAAPKALELLAEACEAEPGCAPAWAFRGEVARARQDLALAEECFRRAVKLDPPERKYTEGLREVLLARR